jgi:hypothetical protein
MKKDPIKFFIDASHFVRKAGFSQEVMWSEDRPNIHELSPHQFVQQHAWTVLTSGFRVQTIQNKWDAICKAFWNFEIQEYMRHPAETLKDALKVFANQRKMQAIIDVGHLLNEVGWVVVHSQVIHDPDKFLFLESLPYIGKITKFHLARNIGFDVIKPDRHLVRLGEYFELEPAELCNQIYEGIKKKFRLGTIDLILWRYCEQGQFPSGVITLDAF